MILVGLTRIWHCFCWCCGAVFEFQKYCWQEFVFVGQSRRAAKSVWEVGATAADWELRAPSTHTSPPAISCVSFCPRGQKFRGFGWEFYSQYIIYALFPKLYAWMLFCQRHNSCNLVSQILYSINLCLKWRVSQIFRCASISRSYSGKSVSEL